VAVDTGRDVFEPGPLHERRCAARHLDALDPAAHAAARLIERLAVLGGDDAGHLLEVQLEQRLELVQHLRAGVHGRVAPGWERARRRLDGRIHIVGRG